MDKINFWWWVSSCQYNIKLHEPASTTSTSSITKRKKTRRGLVNLFSDCPVDVEELLVWVRHYNDMDRVSEIIERFPVLFTEPYLQTRRPDVVLRIPPASYSYLIPRGVLTSITSALTNWKPAQLESMGGAHNKPAVTYNLVPDAGEVIPVAILATHGEFTRRYADVVKQIYEDHNAIKLYREDIEWVRGDWSHNYTELPFFDSSTMPVIPRMAQKVAQLLAESWLKRKFTFRAGASGSGGFIELIDIVGHLAGKMRLSDTVMHCASQYLFSHQTTRCYSVDPVRVEKGEFDFPASALTEYSHVIVPVYQRPLKHWLLQIVSFPHFTSATSSATECTLVLYDPLGVNSNLELLRTKWKTYTLRLLQAWQTRDNDKRDLECNEQTTRVSTGSGESGLKGCASKENESGNVSGITDSPIAAPANVFAPSVTEAALLHPKQPDAVSCGVLCLAQAYTHINNDNRFKRKKRLKQEDVDAMRLCLMWQLLCDFDDSEDARDAAFSIRPDVLAIDKKINQHFKATARSEAVL